MSKLKAERPCIILCGTGSKGDAIPLSELSKEMVSRGFQCKVLSNANHKSIFEHPNVEFIPVCKGMHDNLISSKKLLEEYYKPTLSNTFLWLEKLYQRNKNLSIISLSHNLGAANVFAEKYDLPLVSVYLAPGFISPEEKQLLGKSSLKKIKKSKVASLVSQFSPLLRGIKRHLNNLRLQNGLAKISLTDSYRSIGCRVGLFPRWFLYQTQETFEEIKYCGFPLLKLSQGDPQIKMDNELWDFLEKNNGSLIVFTPGTATVDVNDFFRVATDACRILGIAGLFLSPHIDSDIANEDDNVLLRSYVDLTAVLPFAALIIHHGGIGTLSAAIQAGVPQIIRPIKYDQPHNALRVMKLGIGAVVTKSMFNQKRICKLVKVMMDNSIVQKQVDLAQQEVLKIDAIKLAGEAVEDYVLASSLVKAS